MDWQKCINNSFFALVSGLLSYGVSQVDKINAKIGLIEQSVYQINGQAGVQREINEKLAEDMKELKRELRRKDRRRGT